MDEIEQAVLGKLLAGEHGTLVALREQALHLTVTSREFTGVGFYTEYAVAAQCPSVADCLSFAFGDVFAEVEGLKNLVGFVLFVREGRIVMLEGYTLDEGWPSEPKVLGLTYGFGDGVERNWPKLLHAIGARSV